MKVGVSIRVRVRVRGRVRFRVRAVDLPGVEAVGQVDLE